jgi:D-amino-acid dehydrogenase
MGHHNQNDIDILIMGGGVIGVCSAYYLSACGRDVTVIDKGEIGAGCSYANAGLIVPSHLIPLAAPGVLAQGAKWLLNAESPFYVKPRANLELLAWLWRFRSACKEEPMRRAIPILRELSDASTELYEILMAEERLVCSYKQAGLLSIYNTQHGYEEGVAETRILRQYGIARTMLDRAGVREMEPAASTTVVGGIFFPRDAHLDPALFVKGLAGRIHERGVTLKPGTEALGFETRGRRITGVRTTRGDLRPQQILLATGSWSPGLVRDLGLKLPIQPAKGYSITYRRPGSSPRLPLLLGEASVAVTPMGPYLRFAGTLELAGLDFTINRRRVGAILRAAGRYLDTRLETPDLIEIWRGLRPCTPDGLPIIGRSPAHENLILATGHAMIGVSLGPITGKLVSELVQGVTPTIDVKALSLARFNAT